MANPSCVKMVYEAQHRFVGEAAEQERSLCRAPPQSKILDAMRPDQRDATNRTNGWVGPAYPLPESPPWLFCWRQRLTAWCVGPRIRPLHGCIIPEDGDLPLGESLRPLDDPLLVSDTGYLLPDYDTIRQQAWSHLLRNARKGKCGLARQK
jgi:hypothetical protein